MLNQRVTASVLAALVSVAAVGCSAGQQDAAPAAAAVGVQALAAVQPVADPATTATVASSATAAATSSTVAPDVSAPAATTAPLASSGAADAVSTVTPDTVAPGASASAASEAPTVPVVPSAAAAATSTTVAPDNGDKLLSTWGGVWMDANGQTIIGFTDLSDAKERAAALGFDPAAKIVKVLRTQAQLAAIETVLHDRIGQLPSGKNNLGAAADYAHNSVQLVCFVAEGTCDSAVQMAADLDGVDIIRA